MTQEQRDRIESYVYKWPTEIREAMKRDIQFGFNIAESHYLPLLEAEQKENETLKRQNGAYKMKDEARDKLLSHAQNEAYKNRNAALSVDGERNMNAILTGELEAEREKVKKLVEGLGR